MLDASIVSSQISNPKSSNCEYQKAILISTKRFGFHQACRQIINSMKVSGDIIKDHNKW